MGYYTKYTLSYTYSKAIPENQQKHFDKLIKKHLDDSMSYDDMSGLLLGNVEPVKWYEHEMDLRKLSKKLPMVVFCLEGEGEENGDFWKKYFLAGRMQVCAAKLVVPPYDITAFEKDTDYSKIFPHEADEEIEEQTT